MRRAITARLVAVIVGSELPFLTLATPAFLWLLGVIEGELLGIALTLLGLVYLAKTATLAVLLAWLLAPVEAALATSERATKQALVAAAEAVRRTTILGPVMVALSWGALFYTPALALWATQPNGLPNQESLVSAALFSTSVVIGVLPSSHGIFVLTLRDVIHRVSQGARAAGVVAPRTSPSLRTRLVALALCLALGPTLWVMSMTHAMVVMAEEPPWGLLTVAALFSVIAVAWASVAALAVSGAIVGSIADMGQLVEEISASGGAVPDRVPVLQRDELGRLAGALNEMADKLATVERTKRQFITMTAHELKSPVAVVKGYAQLLRSDATGAGASSTAIEGIERGADRIDRIVRYFLSFAQLQFGGVTLRVQLVELAALVERVTTTLAARLGRDIRFRATSRAWVEADPERIESVVRALVDNAVTYSPPDGEVELSVRTEGDDAIVEVVDHGVGIPDEHKPRIFEPFYRAHADTALDFGGIGLGLYTSREIIRHSGGELWFESDEGGGSTFWFRLPLAAGDHGKEENDGQAPSDGSGGRG